jgi:hypothetical protein
MNDDEPTQAIPTAAEIAGLYVDMAGRIQPVMGQHVSTYEPRHASDETATSPRGYVGKHRR